MSCRLILVEGIPGSGKSTTSQWLTEHLRSAGVDADWREELARPHPVMDRSTWRHCREPDYGERCVARWTAFAAATLATGVPRIWVLEACLFQSSVRFLIEHEHATGSCERYADAIAPTLAQLEAKLVYLVQPRPRDFLERHFSARKGEEVAAKIAAYTETTACARRHGWRGEAGMYDFYSHYRDVCDELVPRLGVPVLELDTSGADWERTRTIVAKWVDKELASGEVRQR